MSTPVQPRKRLHAVLVVSACILTCLTRGALAQSEVVHPDAATAWETEAQRNEREAENKRIMLPHVLAAMPSVPTLEGTDWRRFMGCQVRDGRVGHILHMVHDNLVITPAQEPAWRAFAKASVLYALRLEPACWTAGPRPGTQLSARLALMAQTARGDVDVLQGMSDQVAALYSFLDPDQRRIVDSYGANPDSLFRITPDQARMHRVDDANLQIRQDGSAVSPGSALGDPSSPQPWQPSPP
jgi:hypothetical protein